MRERDDIIQITDIQGSSTLSLNVTYLNNCFTGKCADNIVSRLICCLSASGCCYMDKEETKTRAVNLHDYRESHYKQNPTSGVICPQK